MGKKKEESVEVQVSKEDFVTLIGLTKDILNHMRKQLVWLSIDVEMASNKTWLLMGMITLLGVFIMDTLIGKSLMSILTLLSFYFYFSRSVKGLKMYKQLLDSFEKED